MYCDSRMNRCSTIVLVTLFSLVLASCGGSGSGGGNNGAGGNTTDYTVTANAETGGDISPANATVARGETANFSVIPSSGNSINTVTGCDGTLAGATTVVGASYTTGAITADCTVTASFVSSPLPTLSITDASIAEGDSGTTTDLNFTVTLSAPSTRGVNVDFATSDNSSTEVSAIAGSDYTAGNGTVTIPVASTSATISVSILGDIDVEGDETFIVTLTNITTNAILSTSKTAIGTILNDDEALTSRYIVTANAETGGNISPANATVVRGETTNFSVTPSSGNSINTVTGCDGTLVGATYTTGAITADCTVTASFVNDSLPPTLSITDASVAEGDSGTTDLNFTVTLSASSTRDVNVDFATSDNSPTEGSAMEGNDYTANNGTVTIPAASTSATISVSILADVDVEGDETLIVTLTSTTANAALGTSKTATGTILNDDETLNNDGVALNDTGVTTCSNNTNNGLACPQADYPGQDAEHGRDAQAAAGTLSKTGGGRAGFDFTKLDNSGAPLADQTTTYTTTPWDCVQDNVTGLTWEVKSADGGLRDRSHTYSWYNATGINDGGNVGTANGGKCVDTTNCDTEKYVPAINAARLCGQTDWRLPTVSELTSLIDSAIAFPGPTIDTGYFPNTRSAGYWSSIPYATLPERAWFVYFVYGAIIFDERFGKKSDGLSVRLVRAGQ